MLILSSSNITFIIIINNSIIIIEFVLLIEFRSNKTNQNKNINKIYKLIKIS